MKAIATLLLLSVTLIFGLPLEESDEISEDGWFVPQLDGSLEWMTAAEAKMAELKSTPRSLFGKLKVDFYLFTQENPEEPQRIYIDDAKSLSESNFNSDHPTRFIIHGWQCDHSSEMNVIIREALLDRMECNVIVLDWSQKLNYYSLNYVGSKSNVPKVGKQLAEMIDFLATEGNISLDDVHLIGHSLGAHVAGVAGKHVTAGQIHTIIGLDPAWPLYTLRSTSKRLTDSDALYVETIHTNGGILGFLNPLGKVDFYVNGGESQPGCGLDIGGICSHLRAPHYYAEAIRENNFRSDKCSDWKSAVAKSCDDETEDVRMGSEMNYELADGHYFTPVNKKSPFGTG